MRLTLRQLEVFVAVAHRENITRAAGDLAMSQSAASGALKDLEQQFDMQLFDRIGKRLRLNALGESVRPQAEALLDQARSLESALARHDEVGHLRLGATLTIGNYLAVDLVAQFMRRWPEAEVDLEVRNTSDIAEKVANFELDLGLVEGEVQRPELTVSPWRTDELVVFCAPDHPFAAKGRLTDGDLIAAQWVLRESGSGTRQAFDRAMKGLLPEIQIALVLQHTEAIKRAVESGLGIGCLSRITLEQAFERGSLVPLEVTHRDLSRQLYLIMHRDKYRSATIERWLEFCFDA